VAGVLAAVTNNGIGVAGVAYNVSGTSRTAVQDGACGSLLASRLAPLPGQACRPGLPRACRCLRQPLLQAGLLACRVFNGTLGVGYVSSMRRCVDLCLQASHALTQQTSSESTPELTQAPLKEERRLEGNCCGASASSQIVVAPLRARAQRPAPRHRLAPASLFLLPALQEGAQVVSVSLGLQYSSDLGVPDAAMIEMALAVRAAGALLIAAAGNSERRCAAPPAGMRLLPGAVTAALQDCCASGSLGSCQRRFLAELAVLWLYLQTA
jgi:subtilisin family serine protease